MVVSGGNSSALPNPNAEPNAEPNAVPNSEPNAEPNSEPNAEPDSEPIAEPDSEPNSEPNAEPNSEPISEPNAEPDSEPNAEPDSEPNADPNSELKSGPNSEPDSDPNSDPNAKPNAEPNAAPDSKLNAEPDSEPNAELDSEPNALPAPPPSSLEDAQRLFESGRAAMRADDLDQAAECFSQALEIRVKHFGELAPECAETYYKYGCALLYKAQSESDPLNEPRPSKNDRAGSAEETGEGAEHEGDDAELEGEDGENNGEGDEEQHEEEEESDLDYAWKMLDIARVILEKQNCHSLQEVDVISALADVSLEREDFEMCFRDYSQALEILEGLVDPSNRRIAELCFKLSLAHQLGYKPKEALKHCKRAVSICETHLQQLKSELVGLSASTNGKEPMEALIDSSLESIQGKNSSNNEKEEEIKEIESLLEELREKVLELEDMAAGPSSLLEAFKLANPAVVDTVKQVFSLSAMASLGGEASGGSSSNGFDASALNGNPAAPVVDLGVLGRGAKRGPLPVASVCDSSSKKRSMDAMMTGCGKGETTIGFGKSETYNISSSSSPPPPSNENTVMEEKAPPLASACDSSSKKRSLDAMMTGCGEGETTIGFGTSITNNTSSSSSPPPQPSIHNTIMQDRDPDDS